MRSQCTEVWAGSALGAGAPPDPYTSLNVPKVDSPTCCATSVSFSIVIAIMYGGLVRVLEHLHWSSRG